MCICVSKNTSLCWFLFFFVLLFCVVFYVNFIIGCYRRKFFLINVPLHNSMHLIMSEGGRLGGIIPIDIEIVFYRVVL